jgi:hypothetical protein
MLIVNNCLLLNKFWSSKYFSRCCPARCRFETARDKPTQLWTVAVKDIPTSCNMAFPRSEWWRGNKYAYGGEEEGKKWCIWSQSPPSSSHLPAIAKREDGSAHRPCSPPLIPSRTKQHGRKYRFLALWIQHFSRPLLQLLENFFATYI